jgi:hypothetical protein
VGVHDLDASVHVHQRAVGRGEVAGERAAGLEGDVGRKALDPALDVARAELEIWGWGDADDGQGQVQGRGHPRTLPKEIVSRYNGVLFNPHPTHG